MRLLALLCLLVASPLSAAQITLGGNAQMGCSMTLSGQIAGGDADRFMDFIEDNNLFYDHNSRRKLCLNSPGGSYIDGVKIGGILTGYGIGTAIPSGASCDSACAIAFMGGAWVGEAGAFATDRTLHPQGRIGFHAPSLTVQNRSYTKAEIDTAYGIALLAVAELMQLRADSRFAFPDSLMLEMLATPPQSLRRVDTVLDAAQWNIAVWPVAAPQLDARALTEFACHNAAAQIWDNGDGALQDLPQDFINDIAATPGGLRLTTGYHFADNAARCKLDLSPGWAGMQHIGRAGFPEYDGLPDATLHTVMLYDPDQQIADLPAKPTDFDTVKEQFAQSAGAGQSCIFDSQIALITNVNEFVNMRAGTNFGAEVIRKVGKGVMVDVLADGAARIAPPDPSQKETCAQACANPLSDAAQLTLQTCIDNNALWQQVRIDGQTGWISRRFLGKP